VSAPVDVSAMAAPLWAEPGAVPEVPESGLAEFVWRRKISAMVAISRTDRVVDGHVVSGAARIHVATCGMGVGWARQLAAELEIAAAIIETADAAEVAGIVAQALAEVAP
jgi:hypothetical protein